MQVTFTLLLPQRPNFPSTQGALLINNTYQFKYLCSAYILVFEITHKITTYCITLNSRFNIIKNNVFQHIKYRYTEVSNYKYLRTFITAPYKM